MWSLFGKKTVLNNEEKIEKSLFNYILNLEKNFNY